MTIVQSRDLGTPPPNATGVVQLEVDGQAVTVPHGTSVLRAAALAGVDIPKLCATDTLAAFGSCRLCLVEVEGRPGTPASCTTPVVDGMRVSTQTARLERLRRGVMELYISDHPLDCLTCPANGDCELQDMAGVVGLRDVRYGEGRDHLAAPTDDSNPYFSFDPSKCIVCSRCVRACEEIQGTFALTIRGRGFESSVSPGGRSFLDSECVSCGACVQTCPTSTLQEKSVIALGTPTRTVRTTCGYCGVGCTFEAHARGNELVRMVPARDGGANEGHACVKGRFAWGYATHKDRVLAPMIREHVTDEWRVVDWDEAIRYTAERFAAIRDEHGRLSIGGITSSRCTNEETFVVQKMIRAAFANNNVDTCARVCHSPTGYGLKRTFGTSAGTQDFRSVDDADVIVIIGANPVSAHPVFASRMKRRLRAGARLVVVDPRRTELVRSPHVEAAYHLALEPGSNVALMNALAHVVVTEGLVDRDFVATRCDVDTFQVWADFARRPENSPEATEAATGVPAADVRAVARLYATGGNASIYYGLGVTEHSQGSTMVMAMANLAMATGNVGRRGVGVNPLRGQNNVQGSCDMGSFPHELPGYRHVSDPSVRAIYEAAWNCPIDAEPGLRIPNMFDGALEGTFRALFVQGEDLAQSDPNSRHVRAALAALDLLVVQDLFLNETAAYAHVFLPGTSFLEKDGTFTNAERRLNRVRPVFAPKCGKQEWEAACEIATALGYPMHYDSAAEIMDEIASTTPTFAGVSFGLLDDVGCVQWPCNDTAPLGTPIMHVDEFVRGKGAFVETPFVPTEERANRRFPLLLTTGRVLTQYNVGTQTRRTDNVIWHDADELEIHPHDAEERGVTDGSLVRVASRVGETTLRARVTDSVLPGVVYTTFHFPAAAANVVTTEFSDWATNCPEYKVTAVQVHAGAPRSTNGAAPATLPEPTTNVSLTDLIRMANQIADNFRHHDAPRATEEVGSHIRSFWAPSMRAELYDYIERGGNGVEPIAADALRQLERDAGRSDPELKPRS